MVLFSAVTLHSDVLFARAATFLDVKINFLLLKRTLIHSSLFLYLHTNSDFSPSFVKVSISVAGLTEEDTMLNFDRIVRFNCFLRRLIWHKHELTTYKIPSVSFAL